MPSNITLLLGLAGCLALLAGLFGGGLKLDKLQIPRMKGSSRIFSAVAGLALIGVAIWLHVRSTPVEAPSPTEAPGAASETALPVTEAPASVPIQGAAEVVTVTPAAPASSPTAIPANGKNPAGALSQFFSRISGGNYGEAWLQQTSRYRQANYPEGSVQFRFAWQAYAKVTLKSADCKASQNSADCTVDLALESQNGTTDRQTGQAYHLIYDQRQQLWMIDLP